MSVLLHDLPTHEPAPLEPAAPEASYPRKAGRSIWMGLLFVTFLLALVALLLWWLVL